MRGVPPLFELPDGAYTTADIVAAKATVLSTLYKRPATQATIPTERVDDFLRGEGRIFRTSFHRKAHAAIRLPKSPPSGGLM